MKLFDSERLKDAEVKVNQEGDYLVSIEDFVLKYAIYSDCPNSMDVWMKGGKCDWIAVYRGNCQLCHEFKEFLFKKHKQYGNVLVEATRMLLKNADLL